MKYNVVFVFSDQHRLQATGYAGDPNVNTPNMDRLREIEPTSSMQYQTVLYAAQIGSA